MRSFTDVPSGVCPCLNRSRQCPRIDAPSALTFPLKTTLTLGVLVTPSQASRRRGPRYTVACGAPALESQPAARSSAGALQATSGVHGRRNRRRRDVFQRHLTGGPDRRLGCPHAPQDHAVILGSVQPHRAAFDRDFEGTVIWESCPLGGGGYPRAASGDSGAESAPRAGAVTGAPGPGLTSSAAAVGRSPY